MRTRVTIGCDLISTLRNLCVLSASPVYIFRGFFYRRGAEDAEITRRIFQIGLLPTIAGQSDADSISACSLGHRRIIICVNGGR
jgi:hypothetical protein